MSRLSSCCVILSSHARLQWQALFNVALLCNIMQQKMLMPSRSSSHALPAGDLTDPSFMTAYQPTYFPT